MRGTSRLETERWASGSTSWARSARASSWAGLATDHKQRDGHRVDALGRQLLQPGPGVAEAERDEDAPGRIHPLVDPPGEPAGHQQRGLDPSGRLLQFVVGQPVDLVGLGDGQGRLEPGGGQQAHGGAGAGQQGVQAGRGPVGQDVGLRQQLGHRDPESVRRVGQRGQHPVLEVSRCREGLADGEVAGGRGHDRVGERAAGVDPDQLHATPGSH